MIESQGAGFGSQWSLFARFKYSVYVLLSLNIFLFLSDEMSAAESLFADGIIISDVIRAFAATIDTFAWVILLLLFELETYVLDDRRIKGLTKLFLHGVRLFCYAFVVYACYGYIVKFLALQDFVLFEIDDVCTLVGSGFTYVDLLDDYFPVTAENCGMFADKDVYRLVGTDLIADYDHMVAAIRLSSVDVINASAWILVVVVLEMEVRMQLNRELTSRILFWNALFKFVLYTTLLGAAIYWWFFSDFLDFWDAFLWLVAFIFIELNLFQWQAETKAESA